MKAAIIFNEEAGQGDRLKEISEYLNRENFEYDVFKISGRNLPDILEKVSKKNYEMLVAAGGDGTVSSVAEKAVILNKTMGIIPSGTLNHFAKDAGIPFNTNEALRTITGGKTILIDTAIVNDHIFLNNSSIGLYPKVVKRREEQMKLGGKKWPAMF